MEKQAFIDLTGEDPEDVLGGDWQNELEEDDDPDDAIKLWNER